MKSAHFQKKFQNIQDALMEHYLNSDRFGFEQRNKIKIPAASCGVFLASLYHKVS